MADDSTLAALNSANNALVGSLSVAEQAKANKMNYEIALQNLGLSKKQMEYMRELQYQTWERDDNAISRMVKDLENNGFNKLLAFGTGGLSNTTVAQPNAPQNGFKYNPIDYTTLKQNLINTVKDTEELKLLRDQKEFLKSQKFGQDLSNVLTQIKAEESVYNLDYYQKNGLPTNATGLPKVITEGATILTTLAGEKKTPAQYVEDLRKKFSEQKQKEKRNSERIKESKKQNINKIKNDFRKFGSSVKDVFTGKYNFDYD